MFMFRAAVMAGRHALIVTMMCCFVTISGESKAETVCVPAVRTVEPCPTGYAPKEIIVQSSQQPDPYQSSLDAMPMQEMLLAICVGISGLLGFSVGVRLT